MANQQTVKDPQDVKAEIPRGDHNGGSGNGAQAAKTAADRMPHAIDRGADAAAARTHDMAIAFKTSYGVFTDGIQELQHAYWSILQQSFDVAASAPAELMRCRNMTEVAEIQREVLHKCLDGLVDANRALMNVSNRVTESATRPLREQQGQRAS